MVKRELAELLLGCFVVRFSIVEVGLCVDRSALQISFVVTVRLLCQEYTHCSVRGAPMDEIAELRDALDRLHTLFEELLLRGLRAAGAKEITRLTNIRDEFLTAGAAHIADRLTTLLNAIESGERDAAAHSMRALTAVRLFDRMLTLEFATEMVATLIDFDLEHDIDDEEDE